MLREMLRRALDAIPGLIVVEETMAPLERSTLFHQVQIDWLVVSLEENERLPRAALLLFNQIPCLSLLALSLDGSRVEIWLKTTQSGVLKLSLENVALPELVTLLQYKVGDAQLPPALFRPSNSPSNL
jgi:hypothetical protein